ncbi:MAG: GNAT family N-acetyltransferase [Candidatus Thorarchaeota archaeon]|jgi:ribosomal protein S18 acetylase RimI-like enzyme
MAYEVRIRDFTMSDYPAVKGIWEKVFSLRPVDSEKHIKMKLERDPRLFLVSEVDGDVVGVVFASYDGRQAIIHRLAVLPEHQRKGIGRELVAELLARLKEFGDTRIMVHVGEGYAAEFFKGFGFEESDVQYLKLDTWI